MNLISDTALGFGVFVWLMCFIWNVSTEPTEIIVVSSDDYKSMQMFFPASLWHLLSEQINRETSASISFPVTLTKNTQNCINLFCLHLISPEMFVQFCCFKNLCLKTICRDFDLSVVPQADPGICQGCWGYILHQDLGSWLFKIFIWTKKKLQIQCH